MPYSAVTQPSPLPFLCGGTRSSTLAVQMTLVSPALDEYRAFGVFGVVAGDTDSTKLVGLTLTGTHNGNLGIVETARINNGLAQKFSGAGRSSSMTHIGTSDICSSSDSPMRATTAVVLSARIASRSHRQVDQLVQLFRQGRRRRQFCHLPSSSGLQKPSLHSSRVSPDCKVARLRDVDINMSSTPPRQLVILLRSGWVFISSE